MQLRIQSLPVVRVSSAGPFYEVKLDVHIQ